MVSDRVFVLHLATQHDAAGLETTVLQGTGRYEGGSVVKLHLFNSC